MASTNPAERSPEGDMDLLRAIEKFLSLLEERDILMAQARQVHHEARNIMATQLRRSLRGLL